MATEQRRGHRYLNCSATTRSIDYRDRRSINYLARSQLSDRFGWLGWHKGYAVLTGMAAVGVAMVLMLGWFGMAVAFRRRFQFSIKSLLVVVIVVALPCSWLAVEMKKARSQREAIKTIENVLGKGCQI